MKTLTCRKLGIHNFVYSTVKKESIIELTWKKHILSDNIKFLLGSVTLSLCKDQDATSLLNFAASALEVNQQEIGDLQKNNRLSSERQGALAHLEKWVNIKDEIEKDLFGKFKVVLNEKKAKIHRLIEQLSSVSEQLHNLHQSNNTVVGQLRAASEETKEETGKVIMELMTKWLILHLQWEQSNIHVAALPLLLATGSRESPYLEIPTENG